MPMDLIKMFNFCFVSKNLQTNFTNEKPTQQSKTGLLLNLCAVFIWLDISCQYFSVSSID